MFEKRKEEEESPGCSNERRFDNISFFRKRKKDSKYLGYERIIPRSTLSHLICAYHFCYRVFDACYICPIMIKDQIIRLASVFKMLDHFILYFIDIKEAIYYNLSEFCDA